MECLVQALIGDRDRICMHWLQKVFFSQRRLALLFDVFPSGFGKKDKSVFPPYNQTHFLETFMSRIFRDNVSIVHSKIDLENILEELVIIGR